MHGKAVNINPIHKHIVGWIFDQSVFSQIGFKAVQKKFQRPFAFHKQGFIPGQHIDVIEHFDPDQAVSGVEHSAVFPFEHHCCAKQIKFSKAHIAEGKGRHQAFDIVITRASQRFAMLWAVEMMGLTANFKRMLAGL